MLKRWVLSQDRKTATEGVEVTRSGRLIQTRAAATGKARSPTVGSRVPLTINDEDELERSRWRASTSATWQSSSVRYVGADPCRYLYTKTDCLNAIRSGEYSSCVFRYVASAVRRPGVTEAEYSQLDVSDRRRSCCRRSVFCSVTAVFVSFLINIAMSALALAVIVSVTSPGSHLICTLLESLNSCGRDNNCTTQSMDSPASHSSLIEHVRYHTSHHLLLALWRLMLPYGYSYFKASCARPGHTVICNFDIRPLWRQPWASEWPDIKNYKWLLNPVWHTMLYSCTHMATVGVRGFLSEKSCCNWVCILSLLNKYNILRYRKRYIAANDTLTLIFSAVSQLNKKMCCQMVDAIR